jgi:hypothetical protein
METSTLILWITIGWRVEERGILNLTRGECVTQLVAIETDQARVPPVEISSPKSGYSRRVPTPPAAC